MSSYRLSSPSQPRLSWLYLFAGLVVAAALLAVAAATPRPIHVTVDGVSRQVPGNAVVGDLTTNGLLKSGPGDLLALNGSVLTSGGGTPAETYRNGRRVTAEHRLYEGDSIVSHAGANAVERAVTVHKRIPYKTVVEGAGAISTVATEGVNGVRQIMRGEISRAVSSDFVLREPVDQVIVRSRPAPGTKLVALTFDDGPWPGQTEKILDVLKSRDVRATFFMLGGRVSKYPGVVSRAVAEGNLIGNHSLGHKLLTSLDRKGIHREIQHGAERIARIPGTKPQWFRPPYGAMNSDAWHEVHQLKAHVVLWTVDSQDWRHPGTKRIVDNVVGAVRPGSIILMHDGGGDRRQTVAALPAIIDTLKAQGYVFVTAEELAAN